MFFFFFVFLKLTNFREAGNLSSSIGELKSDAWKYLHTRTEPHETRETLFIDALKLGVKDVYLHRSDETKRSGYLYRITEGRRLESFSFTLSLQKRADT